MAELNVSRKSVQALLSLSDINTKGKIYVIPNYQRPYKWDVEKCETLWLDLTNFFEECKRTNDNSKEYFLGTIVTCTDVANTNQIDVIDGQQRLTTLYLLMRAFYTKLEEQAISDPSDEEISGLMQSIAPCIWNVNKLTLKVTDKTSIHINSEVASVLDNEVFHRILASGEYPTPTNPKAKKLKYSTNYEANYAFFLNEYDKYKQRRPQDWKELCLSIIQRSIVLPIECTDLDSALTIFGTLNDRGLPLTDSDIFKAELYKLCESPKAKQDFSNDWKELDENVSKAGLSIDDIFRYYTHVVRGKNKDNTQEIGLRKFYAGNDGKFNLFKADNFFSTIQSVAGFWISILQDTETFNKNVTNHPYCTIEAKKYIQCLCAYPNDYWRYPTTVFYITHHDSPTFKEDFSSFLKHLMAYMFVRFIEQPSVNAVKRPIFTFCIELAQNNSANFTYPVVEDFKESIKAFSFSKMTKPLLLLNAYLFDDNQPLLKENMDIEHIFPQKWQNTNYNGWNFEDAKSYLNMFGNKIILENRLNIIAGNGYFGQKKRDYAKSKVKEVNTLADYDSNDWLKEDIENRTEQIVRRLTSFFKSTLAAEKTLIPVILLSVRDGDESLTISEIDEQGEKQYLLQIKCKDYSQATPLDIVQNKISMVEKQEMFKTINETVNYIDKVFFSKHYDEIIEQLANLNLL